MDILIAGLHGIAASGGIVVPPRLYEMKAQMAEKQSAAYDLENAGIVEKVPSDESQDLKSADITKRESKTHRRLRKAFSNLGHAIKKRVAPAHDGTDFMEIERQKHAIADLVENNPNPWHEYERLDSETEGEALKAKKQGKKSHRGNVKKFFARVLTTYGEYVTPQATSVPI
ncbi:hypothetical protein GGS21DRAFT_546419 [Xylaria nigripes]|nr:hypothetical protein GGS21DRAFT_546419 [Xylaria nigripes]